MQRIKKDGLTVKEKVFYALGTLGKEVSYGMINTYLMLYLTVFMELNGIIVGFAICLVRLIAAVADPIMATVVNNTKSKLGKFRPWLIAGALINGAVLVTMFLPIDGLSVGMRYFYYLVMYFLWAVSYTVLDVPFMSMIPSIADSTAERESISSLSRLVGGFGGFVIGSGGSIIIGLTFGVENVKSYFVVACVGSILLVAMMGLAFITIKERYKLPCQEVKYREIWSLFKSNDQVRAYSGSYLFFTVGANIAVLQIVYLFIYDTAHLDFVNHFIIFNAVSCTGAGLAMMFYTAITKKLSREKVFSLTYLMAGVGMLLLFGAFFILGENRLVNVIVLSIAGSLLMTANSMNQIASMVMITDVVDYGEYKTGIRSDSIMISVQTMLIKVAGALAMLVIGIGVYVSGLPSINLLTNTFSGEITDKALLILRIFMFLLPVPLMPIGYAFYKKNYKLCGKFYDEVKKKINLNRDAKKSEAPVAEAEKESGKTA